MTSADYDKFTSDTLDVRTKQRELVNKSDTDKKLISTNKKIMLNETKHVETDKKNLTDLAKNAAQISREGYDSLLGRMYVIGNDDYENFLVFAPMLSSLILGSNRNVTNWISTIISSEKIKPFNNGLEPTISDLANGRVYLKLTNSILLQKSFS